MSYRMISLREASHRCRTLADVSDDGLSALSYAQLADEIDGMIDRGESTLATARAAPPIRRSAPSSLFVVGGHS